MKYVLINLFIIRYVLVEYETTRGYRQAPQKLYFKNPTRSNVCPCLKAYLRRFYFNVIASRFNSQALQQASELWWRLRSQLVGIAYWLLGLLKFSITYKLPPQHNKETVHTKIEIKRKICSKDSDGIVKFHER